MQLLRSLDRSSQYLSANRIYLWVGQQSESISDESRSRRIHLFRRSRFDTVLSFVAEEEEFDITAVKYSRSSVSGRSTAPEIRRPVFLAVEIHARRYRQPHLTNRENWEQPEKRIRGVLHRECMITSASNGSTQCALYTFCRVNISYRMVTFFKEERGSSLDLQIFDKCEIKFCNRRNNYSFHDYKYNDSKQPISSIE